MVRWRFIFCSTIRHVCSSICRFHLSLFLSPFPSFQVPKPKPVLTTAEIAQNRVKNTKPKLLTHPAFCPRPNPPNTELRRYCLTPNFFYLASMKPMKRFLPLYF
jgi:hypothetical protein